MSEKTQDVLLDSNAYFRLAPSVRPLLKEMFGQTPQYSLHVLAELDDEYNTSTRLRHKFEWVRNAEYRQDRQCKRYELRGQARTETLNAFSFLVSYADQQRLNLSREDLKALATGYVKGIPVVTDDRDMRTVAEAHSIECWNLIKLLKVMVTGGRIDMEKVTEVLEYLDYENDLPMPKDRLRREFKGMLRGRLPDLSARERQMTDGLRTFDSGVAIVTGAGSGILERPYERIAERRKVHDHGAAAS